MEKSLVYKIYNAFFCLVFTNCTTMKNDDKELTYPVAKKIPHEINDHGVNRIDDYFWLNDRDNKEVIAYLKEENNFTQKYFAKHKSLNDSIYAELKSRIVNDDESVPYPMNGYMYYSKYRGDNEHAMYYRNAIQDNSTEELLLDVNSLAKGKSFCEEGTLEISPDNKLLAYSVDFLGRRKYGIYFTDLRSGKKLADVVENTSGSIVWASDSKTVFYAVEDEKTLRSYKIMKHVLGESTNEDVCVYEEKDETFNVDVERSRSGNYILFIRFLQQQPSVCTLNQPSPNRHSRFLNRVKEIMNTL